MKKAILILVVFSLSLLGKEKILVTGGAGYVGSHIAEQLLDNNYEVVIIDNLNTTYNPELKKININSIENHITENNSLSIYYIDLCDAQKVKEVFAKEQPTIVCHFAAMAEVRPSVVHAKEYIQNNLLSTLSIFESCAQYPVSHVILASSSCTYGDAGIIPYEENQLCDKPRSPYGFTKRAMEMLAYTYHHLYNIKCTCLRTFTGYGPRARPDTAAFKFMDAIHHNKAVPLYGDGKIIRDFTYVGDVVCATLLAIEKPFEFEIINISGGKEITIQEFAQKIANEIGITPTFNYFPPKPQDQIITKASIEKAKKLLGYQPQISFEDGIKQMYEWYKKEYLSSIH